MHHRNPVHCFDHHNKNWCLIPPGGWVKLRQPVANVDFSQMFEHRGWARYLNKILEQDFEHRGRTEQDIWTKYLNKMFEQGLSKIFEQNTWTRAAWLRCLNNVQIKVLYWEGKRTNGNDEETTNMIICVEFLEKTVT